MLGCSISTLFRSIIIHRLHKWHDGSSLSAVPWDCTFQDALHNQDAITIRMPLVGTPFYWARSPFTGRALNTLITKVLGWTTLASNVLKSLSSSSSTSCGRDMREHRNGIKHNTLRPAKCQALQLLDQRILSEFTACPSHLLPCDKRWLCGSAHELLAKFDMVQKSQLHYAEKAGRLCYFLK
jgi:hypothetical protein